MEYNKRLEAYVLHYEDLAEFDFTLLEDRHKRFILEVENTKELTKDLLEKVNVANFSIQIRGGYTKKRAAYWNKLNSFWKNKNTGYFQKRGVSYYEDVVIYTVPMTIKIIEELEKIEAGIKPQWSKIKKALYVYDYLREEVVYATEKYENSSYYVRTLRALVYKEAVCAGFSLIFKEAMDRQGIDCDYVEGTTTNAQTGNYLVTHAWNLLKIDDIIFPIDLTWDAIKYKRGDSKAFKNFSNLTQFNKKHFPHKLEEVQDYNQELAGIRSGFVLKTIESFRAKRTYINSVLNFKTRDDKKIVIAQVGYDEDKPGARIYRYLWGKSDDFLGYVNYEVLYTPVNLLDTLKALESGKISTKDSKYNFVMKLFAEENVKDSIRKNSSFLGFVNFDEDALGIFKPDAFMEGYPINFCERSNKKGISFVIEEDRRKVVVGSRELYRASIMRFNDDNSLTIYQVYSERSFIENDSYDYIDNFLDFERLDERTENLGGYLGYYNKDGIIVTNALLEEEFSVDDAGELTLADIIPPCCEENFDYVEKIDVDLLYQVFDKYNIFKLSTGYSFMIEKSGNKGPIEDKKKVAIASFANLWCQYIDYDSPIKRPLYDVISRNCIGQIEDQGYVQLRPQDFRGCGFCNNDLIENVLRVFNDNPTNLGIVTEYFKLQAPYFKVVEGSGNQIETKVITEGNKKA